MKKIDPAGAEKMRAHMERDLAWQVASRKALDYAAIGALLEK